MTKTSSKSIPPRVISSQNHIFYITCKVLFSVLHSALLIVKLDFHHNYFLFYIKVNVGLCRFVLKISTQLKYIMYRLHIGICKLYKWKTSEHFLLLQKK